MIVDPPTLFDANHSSSDHLLHNKIFTATGLTVIEVTGQDAPEFLQGQLTCNINDLSESQASIAAFCNAKGRVISTLVVVKTQHSFLLILPDSLIDTVLNKLCRYVLRAQVQLHNQTDALQLLGLQVQPGQINESGWPTANFAVGHHPAMLIKLPSAPRYLLIATPIQAQDLITHLREQQGFEPGELNEWRYQDISSALPWFDINQTEQHVPQMLNLDRLGGISFNKGCYTGQEIVARSHYLGKVKRALFVAECRQPDISDHGCAVLDSNNLQNLGCVLAASTWAGVTRLLLVLQIVDGQPKNLILDDDHRTPLAIISDY